jgi:hypothetical protein
LTPADGGVITATSLARHGRDYGSQEEALPRDSEIRPERAVTEMPPSHDAKVRDASSLLLVYTEAW